jgi:AAA family ATP:ADP antiporter
MIAVREEEREALGWACAFVFSLLAGNYLIRPVRDEMGIAGGTDHLPVLFAGTLVAMLVAWPLLSRRLGSRPGPPSLAPVFRILQLSLVAFYAAFHLAPASGQPWAARAFFVWASIANLLVISIAWGSLAGRFNSDQAHRLYGLIAAGGTLGAIVGSSLAGLLAVRAGPTWLMLFAIAFLEAGLLAGRRLLDPSHRIDLESPPRPDGDAPRQPGPPFYQMGLGLWTFLFTTTSAFVYMEQARIVDASIVDAADRTAFFARIDLLVNALGLILQISVTGRILACLGAGGAAAILPALTLAGAIVLALRPTVATVQWFQVIRRAADYAIARPSREVFYTALGRGELSRTKSLIDTAVYRAGDAAGAWAYGLIATIPGLSWAAPLGIVPLSMLWIVVSLALGRSLRRLLAGPGEAEAPRPRNP